MKFDYTFKHLDHSDALIAYAQGRLEKLVKFELKPMHVHFNFSIVKHECQVDIIIKGADLRLKATGIGEDHYEATDSAMEKVSRQLAKKKEMTQYHKRPHFSDEGTLDRMTESLDHDFSKIDGVVRDDEERKTS